MVSGVIRWEDPPTSNRGRRVGTRMSRPDPYSAVADDLRSRPNCWAVLSEGPNNGALAGLATSIVRGLYPSWEPAGSFHAVCRKRNGVTALYAKYVGDGPPETPAHFPGPEVGAAAASTAAPTHNQPRLSAFIARVDNTGGPNACWPWLGSPDRYGYGRFGKPAAGAHRVAYELMVGPIPDGLHIDHLCHNRDTACAGGVTCPHRRCVNPAHLDAVTNRENLRRSGRLGHGLSNGNATKTHCLAGHPFDEANTRRDRRGIRVCKACDRHRVQARRAASRG